MNPDIARKVFRVDRAIRTAKRIVPVAVDALQNGAERIDDAVDAARTMADGARSLAGVLRGLLPKRAIVKRPAK